jgi:hypothetical protein
MARRQAVAEASRRANSYSIHIAIRIRRLPFVVECLDRASGDSVCPPNRGLVAGLFVPVVGLQVEFRPGWRLA